MGFGRYLSYEIKEQESSEENDKTDNDNNKASGSSSGNRPNAFKMLFEV